MDPELYKINHEKHMMFNNGTSINECGIILSMIPMGVFFSLSVASGFSVNLIPILEFLIIVFPVILGVTIFAEINHALLVSLGVADILVFCSQAHLKKLKIIFNSSYKNDRSIITNYRASTNFVTAICILAVDFKVFPKRLAKTETFGFGLMDLGVGFFICANGLVEKHSKDVSSFIKLLKGISILFILGMCRLISIKSLNYHEHLTEYGVHWNFFFTLAFCKIVIYLVTCFLPNTNSLWIALFCGIIHELFLQLGLKDWVLSNAPRDSFWSANREGLVSCMGYISLYFAANALGKYIIHSKTETYKTLLIKLTISFVITWWGTCRLKEVTGISRRIVNIGYIFWVLSSSLLVIILFLIGQMSLLVMYKSNKLNVPMLQESINSKSLFFFVFSNLLTGLINLILQTLLIDAILSMIIIISYMVVLCTVTHVIFIKRIHLKI